ncbi:MAG: helix-turn-helix transcriptional regulator [Holophagales bacterium]|nr:helix-turn-helix transcriptional regulator [Holophagales bacterium]
MASPSRPPTPAGEVILERLESLSWSIAELERRTALTKNTISNAVYGPRQPQRKTLELLSAALDLPPESLTRAEGGASSEAVSQAEDGATTAAETGSGGRAEPRWERFGDWLFRRANASLWIVVLGAGLTAWLLLRDLAGDFPSPWVPGVHFLVILVLLLRLPRADVGPRLEEGAPAGLRIALTAAADLRRHWGRAWFFWLVLYLLLTVGAFLDPAIGGPGEPTAGGRWLTVAFNLAQNGTTVMLFLAYEVVARPTVEADLSRKQVLPPEAWLALAVLPTVLEAGVLLLGHAWPVQQSFGWLSGFAQGTALALLAGRLDSKYIGPPALLVASLYVYAAIQGAWPVFQARPELMLVLTFLALVLKGLLFLFVEWLFQSRILLYYLERLRVLDEDVRRGRREFLARAQRQR